MIFNRAVACINDSGKDRFDIIKRMSNIEFVDTFNEAELRRIIDSPANTNSELLSKLREESMAIFGE